MKKAEKTRQYIVEKTAPVFNKKGFAGTTLTDLTLATGLTKGSIYGNFANKDEVALAVFDFNVAQLTMGIAAAAADGGSSAVDKLLKMAEFHRKQFKNSLVTGGCPILNTATEADDTHALLKERVAKSIRAWKNNIEKIVKQGISRGEIIVTVNAGEFATEYIALIEGGIMLARTTGDPAMLNTAVSRVQKIINTELKA